jgi:hypothetical protein
MNYYAVPFLVLAGAGIMWVTVRHKVPGAA